MNLYSQERIKKWDSVEENIPVISSKLDEQ